MRFENIEKFKKWLERMLKYNDSMNIRLDRQLDKLIDQYARTGNTTFELSAEDCKYDMPKHYRFNVRYENEVIIEF